MWLGYEDSNLGMPESESGALPLGDTPTMAGVPGFEPGNAGIKNRCLTAWRYPNNRAVNRLLEEDGWGTWIRTRECRYQKPVPYRLAIPHPYNAFW